MIEDLGCHYKQVLYIFAALCRRLEMELYTLLPLELFYAIDGHLPLVLHVLFVAHEEKNYIWFALSHHLVVPRVQVRERLQPGDVVGQKYAMGSAIEDLCYALE